MPLPGTSLDYSAQALHPWLGRVLRAQNLVHKCSIKGNVGCEKSACLAHLLLATCLWLHTQFFNAWNTVMPLNPSPPPLQGRAPSSPRSLPQACPPPRSPSTASSRPSQVRRMYCDVYLAVANSYPNPNPCGQPWKRADPKKQPLLPHAQVPAVPAWLTSAPRPAPSSSMRLPTAWLLCWRTWPRFWAGGGACAWRASSPNCTRR